MTYADELERGLLAADERLRAALLKLILSSRYRGAWAASTPYRAGDLVSRHKLIWLRTVHGVSGSTFNAANWQPLNPPAVATPATTKVLLPNFIANSAGSTHVHQNLYCVPIDVPAGGLSCSGLTASLTTQQLTGGSTTFTLAPWADDGTGDAPDWARGPLVASTTIDMTTAVGTKNTSQAFTAPCGAPSIWLVALYLEPSAPGTKGQFLSVSQAVAGRFAANGTWTAIPKCKLVSSIAAYPAAGAAPGTLAPSSAASCPVLGLIAA